MLVGQYLSNENEKLKCYTVHPKRMNALCPNPHKRNGVDMTLAMKQWMDIIIHDIGEIHFTCFNGIKLDHIMERI